ncbi:MAG TPA: PTS transporter subunit EIIC, partial [Candidatus Eremiobacteraceae bacterium]|nr:PTS transporter subunit EIIC [Candidatus Eremiobacteraceae bacterium]
MRSAASSAEAVVASIEARLFPALRRFALEPHMAAIGEAMGPAFVGMIVVTAIAFFGPPELPIRSSLNAYSDRFFGAYHIGFGAMGIVLAVLLADRLARSFGFDRACAILTSLAAFAFGLHWPLEKNFWNELGVISSTSILLGLIVALVAGEAFRFAVTRIRIAVLAHALAALAVLTVFGALAAAHIELGDALLALIRPLVGASDTLLGLLLVVFFQTLLWTAGVHGPAFLSGIVTPIYLKAIDENSQAFAHHQVPPHIVTFMLSLFYYPGGSGATLSLAIVMLRSRIARLRKLALASLLPTLWNINEPLIFGVPLVMNPSLTIPFLGVPLVLATVSFLATWLHLVSPTVVYVPPFFPSFIGAWLATSGDWRSVVLVFANIAIGVAIYVPFFRAYERSVL